MFCSDYIPPKSPVYDTLFDVYSTNRYYHGLTHITTMMLDYAKASAYRDLPQWPFLAILFHDSIYIPGSSVNELQSKELYRTLCLSGDVDPKTDYQIVDDAIMATVNHVAPYAAPGMQEFLDADMAPLALPYDQFVANTVLISQEFSQYAPEEFLAGRVAFLEGLVYPIFKSESFAHLEFPAVNNIRKYIHTHKEKDSKN